MADRHVLALADPDLFRPDLLEAVIGSGAVAVDFARPEELEDRLARPGYRVDLLFAEAEAAAETVARVRDRFPNAPVFVVGEGRGVTETAARTASVPASVALDVLIEYALEAIEARARARSAFLAGSAGRIAPRVSAVI